MLCKKLPLIAALVLLSGCQIYQSPDRKDFENDRGQFQIQSYRIQSCAKESIAAGAQKSEVLHRDSDVEVTQFTWEGLTLIEAKYQQGDYCVLVQE